MKTPNTLREAIENGLSIGPIHLIIANTKDHVQDYLAQKFGIAYMECIDHNEMIRLEKLWKSIVNRETNEKE